MSLPEPQTALPAPVRLEADGAFPWLRFDNSFVRELPGDPRCCGPCAGRCAAPAISRVDADAGRARPSCSPRRPRSRRCSVCRSRGRRPTFARCSRATRAAGHGAVRGCYGGHQFGTWAGQLGDGRAITLGEVVNARGERWELQLKGAGPTPYSRTADGRAVLRSSLRELVCSEAMHHLGVPTTRALSLVAHRGAGGARHVLRRPSRGRAGRGRVPRRAVVPALRQLRDPRRARRRGRCSKRLADYTIRTHFPDSARRRASDLRRACSTRCAAHRADGGEWMRVGFVHGVMNTDNMSILG